MRAIERLSAICLFLSAVALTASAQSNVWVVDALGLPGTDFTDVQPAIDAAVDGDVVLVKGRLGHTYGGFEVDGKTLLVAGELDDLSPLLVLAPPETGPIWIHDLDVTQTVYLRGLAAQSLVPAVQPSLRITDCAGKAVLEEVILRRGDGPNPVVPTPPALAVLESKRVSLVRTLVTGEDAHLGSMAGTAVELTNASVVFQRVQVVGGAGAQLVDLPGLQTPPTPGGTGVHAFGSALFAAGSLLQGGAGGRGGIDAAMNCVASEDGGTGLVLDASGVAASSGTTLDTTLLGGLGGPAPGPGCPAGQQGADVDTVAGTLSLVAATARGFQAQSPVREDETTFLRFDGEPGDLALLLYGGLGDFGFAPFYAGALHLSPIAGFLAMGIVPASGQLLVPVQIVELGPGIDAALVPLQGLFVEPASAQIVLADPSALLLLDRAL